MFLCIAFQQRALDILDAFDSRFRFEDVSAFPIGVAALGGHKGGNAILVTTRGCSTDIMGKGTRKDDLTRVFLDGLHKILEQIPSVTLFVHWFHGLVTTEAVAAVSKQKISFAELSAVFPDIQEDVRFVVVRGM